MPEHAVCAEIGVWRGDFSARILKITQPRVLHLIDPWQFRREADYKQAWYGGAVAKTQEEMDALHSEVAERFRSGIEGGSVVINRQSSVEAAASFPDNYFDW